MKYLSFIIAFVLMLTSCTSEYFSSPTYNRVSIVGNLSVPFYNDQSRAVNSGYLEDGSIISFYSSGGLFADNLLLTYNNGRWNPPTELQWSAEPSDANITAYYPQISEQEFSFYENDGRLKDFLFTTCNIKYGNPVVLQFNHLFSQLVFQVTPILNRRLKNISFTPSISISSINFKKVQLTYTADNLHTTTFTKQESGIYTLIVPPASDMSVDITLETSDGNYTAQVTTSTFQQGHQYNYHLKSDYTCGINTAEDFIAFTYLINGKEYAGRTLEEFGSAVNGRMVYYLLNDIHFTSEDCNRLQSIGHYDPQNLNNMGFKDCLDGQNFSLYNLQLSSKEDMDSYALFSFVDTTGVIKNLNLINASFTGNHTCKYEALLIGRNNGTITGCHIKGNNTFTEVTDNKVGGMVGINRGYIINCSSENIEFQHSNGKAGGIVYSNYGKILNCYTSGCNFLHTISGAGICYTMEPQSEMKNCYAYKTSGYSPKKKYGSLANITNHSIIECGLYCDDNVKAVYSNYQTTPKQIYSYDASTLQTEDGTPAIDILNNWIENNAILYPQHTFYNWVTGDIPPITLQQP